MFKNVPENLRKPISAFMPFAIVIILFIFVGNFGLSKIREIRGKISLAQRDQTVLTQKLQLLQTVGETVGVSVNAATAALPIENPALSVISQIKAAASENSVSISGLKSGTAIEAGPGISKVDLVFDAAGSREQILAFFKKIGSIAPITVVDRVRVNSSGGNMLANVSVRTFWAREPEKLPASTDPITNLTTDEQSVLDEVSALSAPTFVEVPPAEGGKADPFVQ